MPYTISRETGNYLYCSNIYYIICEEQGIAKKIVQVEANEKRMAIRKAREEYINNSFTCIKIYTKGLNNTLLCVFDTYRLKSNLKEYLDNERGKRKKENCGI